MALIVAQADAADVPPGSLAATPASMVIVATVAATKDSASPSRGLLQFADIFTRGRRTQVFSGKNDAFAFSPNRVVAMLRSHCINQKPAQSVCSANATPHGPRGFTGCKPRCIGQSLGFSGPIAAFSGSLDRQIEVE
jgi:hypothetical protein